jgi:hypothetical protein
MSDNLASLLQRLSVFACKSWRMREPKQDAQLSVRHQFRVVFTTVFTHNVANTARQQ